MFITFLEFLMVEQIFVSSQGKNDAWCLVMNWYKRDASQVAERLKKISILEN